MFSRTLVAYIAVVVGLVALHLIATGFTGRLAPDRLAALGITPATTMSHWWRHLWAGLFHTTLFHIAFNLALFSAAFPIAMRSYGIVQTLGYAYLLAPLTVFLLQVAVVVPLAKVGSAYALDALDRPLVGFSVIAYTVAGMAMLELPRIQALVATGVVLAFELSGGALLRLTGPFVFVYHLAGFAVGAGARWATRAWG